MTLAHFGFTPSATEVVALMNFLVDFHPHMKPPTPQQPYCAALHFDDMLEA